MAEDYLSFHKTLKKLFTSLFRSVNSAVNGEEALKLYKNKLALQENYGIVFADIEMPFVNGVELVEKIRECRTHENIVIFSAHQDSKYLLALINQSVRRFIPKPASLMGV